VAGAFRAVRVGGRGRHVRRRGVGLAALAAGAGLVLVVVGSVVRVAGGAVAAVDPGLGYDPGDTGSLSAVSRMVGAQGAWAAGYVGAGVDVAVIDTGVAPVPGLDGAGKVVAGPDLSLDAPGAAVAGLDGFGHGTFMAGLIAGRDAGVGGSAVGCARCVNASGYSDVTKFVGIAPEARIVNVKVGAADGAADVTQVIAGVDWVVQHAHDPGLNIRVISLSYGTDSAQASSVDPLAPAVEQAWKHGIVVVAAAGNDGKAAKELADPGYDPYVIAVGGDDPLGTVDPADDVVPSFAQHGTTHRPVDVTAPAVHVIGLRVPGSFVDGLASNTGQVGSRFQRGSGTSEATAIVSGVVALVLQRYPGAAPDQVKALLGATATRLASGNANAPGQRVHWGYGIVNAARAVAAGLPDAGAVAQTGAASTGAGTLNATRNGVYVTDAGINLTGQQDIFGQAFDSAAMASAQARAGAWTGGIWNGHRWSGDGWEGHRWSSTTWTGTDWAGTTWDGHRWSGTTWDGHRWSGTGWGGAQWTGSTWDDSRWAHYALG
jgi:serine protease AprX